MTDNVIECRNTETIVEDSMFETLAMIDEALSEKVQDSIYVGRSEQYRTGWCHRWVHVKRGQKREQLLALKAEIEQNICDGVRMCSSRLWWIRQKTV